MICVNVIPSSPAECRRSALRFVADALRLAFDELMLAIGFIPHGHNLDAELLCLNDRLQLSLALLRESIADSKCIFFNFFHDHFVLAHKPASSGGSVAYAVAGKLKYRFAFS